MEPKQTAHAITADPSEATAEGTSVEQPAVVRKAKRTVIKSRFGLRPDWTDFPPLAEQGTPEFRIATEFWRILSGLATEIEGWGTTGVLSLFVKASIVNRDTTMGEFADAEDEERETVTGELPDALNEVLDPEIRRRLPTVIKSPSNELLCIYRGEIEDWGNLELYARFTPTDANINNANILKLVHTGKISRTFAEPMEEVALEKPPEPKSLVPHDVTHDYATFVAEHEKRQREEKLGFSQKLLPLLKDEMRAMPHQTHEDKKELVKWVNAELRRLGLDFKHPTTGSSSTFKAGPGNDPQIGRFMLSSDDSEGVERTAATPDLETFLSKLELMPATPRHEPIMDWQATVGKNRRSGRRK